MSEKNKPIIEDFAPGKIGRDIARKYYEMSGESEVRGNRYLVILIFTLICLALSLSANFFLFPLKTVEVQLVRQAEGGRLIAEGEAVGKWVPDNDAIAYFINNWVRSVYDINRATIADTVKESSDFVIGTATAQLRTLRQNNNPFVLLSKYPAYSRSYERITVNFISDDVAFVRFRTITRVNADDPVVVTYGMRVTYTRVKPTTKEEIFKNPAGLFITSFDVSEEAVKK